MKQWDTICIQTKKSIVLDSTSIGCGWKHLSRFEEENIGQIIRSESPIETVAFWCLANRTTEGHIRRIEALAFAEVLTILNDSEHVITPMKYSLFVQRTRQTLSGWIVVFIGFQNKLENVTFVKIDGNTEGHCFQLFSLLIIDRALLPFTSSTNDLSTFDSEPSFVYSLPSFANQPVAYRQFNA